MLINTNLATRNDTLNTFLLEAYGIKPCFVVAVKLDPEEISKCVRSAIIPMENQNGGGTEIFGPVPAENIETDIVDDEGIIIIRTQNAFQKLLFIYCFVCFHFYSILRSTSNLGRAQLLKNRIECACRMITTRLCLSYNKIS